ncbi:CDP-diacylglycerol--glycerol-3-phosphate 3-phosphatidyltransferase [Fundidesulfovibrio magnetotacticus]|uniref:CDP-diacylglycerol--glycerol-3-phosphate 3-phosphatidyltransferase n=1 Tax=Fundidesulfovibrio magnetotacticus TaxID=2730080 RepID=A0A6V8LVE9_9BACT|nr:CDP-alcohol phosphatidyltransferase family protein [Fundidesulfovibrio magnetotacticus]GFK94571.1 CDP-diacylglycerol--glycerol-3-phosphate 3-phosphatidyltransferase [Fundidesulfovibrio magnetotacticus]
MAPRNPNWTIPNALTMARILFTPLFVALFVDQDRWAALSLFFLAGVTDALDGFLARVLDQRSALGAILDPLADKMLLDAAYVCLAVEGWIPGWLAVAVVSRDVLIVGGIALLTYWGQDMRGRMSPSAVSKATTAAQMGLVLAAFALALDAGGAWLASLAGALVWITAALTLASGIHYVARGLALFGAGQGRA